MATGEASGWTASNVAQAKAWYARCQCWRFVYLDCESRNQKWHNAVQIVMFVLMAMSPTTSFATFLDGVDENTRLTMVGAVSSAVMLLRSLQNFWKLEDKIHEYRATALKFQELNAKLKNELLTPAHKRTDWNQFKQKVLETMMAIHASAPSVPWVILEQHNMHSHGGGSGGGESTSLNEDPGQSATVVAPPDNTPPAAAGKMTRMRRAMQRVGTPSKATRERRMASDMISGGSMELSAVGIAPDDGGLVERPQSAMQSRILAPAPVDTAGVTQPATQNDGDVQSGPVNNW